MKPVLRLQIDYDPRGRVVERQWLTFPHAHVDDVGRAAFNLGVHLKLIGVPIKKKATSPRPRPSRPAKGEKVKR